MVNAIAESLKQAASEHPDAVFTLFTLSGHAISGKIKSSGETVILEAGKERAEVTADRIEAFSLREP
ncbi:MAG TPA: hypothetical protein VL993_10045 [Stellaceae bacterium]|nr:hypothetical protein [Stellaceae bacterium]